MLEDTLINGIEGKFNFEPSSQEFYLLKKLYLLLFNSFLEYDNQSISDVLYELFFEYRCSVANDMVLEKYFDNKEGQLLKNWIKRNWNNSDNTTSFNTWVNKTIGEKYGRY